MRILDRPGRNLFFTGKGGVGKTSTACAVAVALADAGKDVLLVSTDPASNIAEVLGAPVAETPAPIAGVPRLEAMNVDPEAAAAAYRERVVGPYRRLLPPDAVASIEEQLAGACTVEIAAFDEFAKLLGDPGETARFDHIVFDTAPTGHTLRLLALPAAWTDFIGDSAGGTSCLGPLQGLKEKREVYAAAVAALSDPAQTTMVLVSRPERAALEEAARTSAELAEIGVACQRLVINAVFTARDRNDGVARAMEAVCDAALASMPKALASLERVDLPLRASQVIGISALRTFFDTAAMGRAAPTAGSPPKLPPELDALIGELAARPRGVIMTMGKGGVGKTTIAARIATELARRGLRVHLTTTDPAAHVARSLKQRLDTLTIGEIDPAVEVARYRTEVMANTGAKLDAAGRALLREDLSSPCTEEVAVFQAFAGAIEGAVDGIVVIDTAPTGHTLLLLDAAQSYHREMMRQAKGVSDAVRALLPRLRDPRFTRVVLCTVAEATPVHEAAALQADLRRASIEPYAWVVNQSLAPLRLADPVLLARRAQEIRYLDEVMTTHARRAFIAAWDAQLAAGVDVKTAEAGAIA